MNDKIFYANNPVEIYDHVPKADYTKVTYTSWCKNCNCYKVSKKYKDDFNQDKYLCCECNNHVNPYATGNYINQSYSAAVLDNRRIILADFR